MVRIDFTRKEFDFLKKFEYFTDYFNNPIVNGEKISIVLSGNDYEEFQISFDGAIVKYGMNNQDTVNKTGIELYRIYDEKVMNAEFI